MSIPIIDPRTKKDILDDISRRAPFYTPEWRYHPEDADAGTALAFIWADMFFGVIDRYNRVLDNYRRALLDAVGSDPQPPVPTQGYLCFTPQESSGTVVVPAGSGASSPDNPEAALIIEQETVATPAKITGVLYTNPNTDICKCYEPPVNITLFESHKSGEHIWFFSHPYAFDISCGAVLKLEIDSTAVLFGDDVHWQYESGEEWFEFSSVEAEADGRIISLRFPDEMQDVCTSVRFILNGADEFRNSTLSGVRASPSGAQLMPEAIYAGDTQASDEGFYPFDRRFTQYNSFYLSCREALSKPGAVVELTFDLRTAEIEIEGYPQPTIARKRVMKPDELQQPEVYEISIADTAWEYFNGTGWTSLQVVSENARTVFASARRTLIHYTLSFVCPSDIVPTVWGAHDALFVRARVVSVDNLYRTNGYYITPWIERPRFNYHFDNGIRIEKASVTENLDSREVPLLSATSLSGRIFDKPAVCLAFDRQFSDGSMLLVLASGASTPSLVWEYYSQSGWMPLDVHDETSGLNKTGVVSYHTPIPAAKLRLMGRDAWWIRLVSISPLHDSSMPVGPRLIGIYENAAVAQARVPGRYSNLPAGAYRTVLPSIPGIAAAVNPLAARGGCDGEGEDRIITRLTAVFNHNNRAISRTDIERLALESSLQVLRCRCIPFTDAAGVSSPTDSCLVILREGGAARQDDFASLSEQIGKFIEERRLPIFSSAGRLHIIEPHYIRLSITLHGGIRGMESALTLKTDITKALERYLDPVSGGENGSGWQIGELPSPSRITLMLREATQLAYIRTLSVRYTRSSKNGGTILNYSDAVADKLSLPGNGLHEIFLEAVR